MNTQRVIVLGLALVAAVGAALMVRSMIGGGTPRSEAKPAPVVVPAPEPAAATPEPASEKPAAPGEVVSLDSFRKK